MEASLPALLGVQARVDPVDVRRIHAEHGTFLWRSLHALGVAEADLEDVIQEVLLVVHRRGASYDPARAKITTWLYGICLRVARAHRRRGRGRPEPEDAVYTGESDERTPESELQRREAERRLRRILDGLSADKRAAFVLFELEGLSCEQIAELMGVPLGTVHSRIHAARAHFKKALAAEGTEP